MYPDIDKLVVELVKRKKYIYLCTNAILLKEKLDLFTPSKYLTFSVHMDGLREEHDEAVCRDGVFDEAVEGIKAALERGFRVTTNTTLFDGASPLRMRQFFDEMMNLGVEGMMLSPATATRRRPTRSTSCARRGPTSSSPRCSRSRKRQWKFNQSPLFLRFLMGKQDFECTPWGNPTFNMFGWQRPCYLLQEGYAATFQELMDDHAVGELRQEERQREVPRLHGPLRVRGDGGGLHVQLREGLRGDGGGHASPASSRGAA